MVNLKEKPYNLSNDILTMSSVVRPLKQVSLKHTGKQNMCVNISRNEKDTLVGIITRDGIETSSYVTSCAKKPTEWHSKSNTDSSEKASLDDIIRNRIMCPPNLLKKRLLSELNWERKCSSCRLTKWLGDPIALKLSHIDGNINNNNVDNLKLLCANCYCQSLIKCDDDSSIEITSKNKKHICKDCNSRISENATRCIECNGKKNRKIARPSRDQLVKDKHELRFFTCIGKKYGVSDNAVRKWFKKYSIDS